MLLTFAPFIAFAVLDRLLGPLPALLAGAVVATGLMVRDRAAGRSPKLIEIGTAILFAGLACWTMATQQVWSVVAVRLCVDAGLLAIVLASMALGQPFTQQYAREQVPPAQWGSAAFRRANMVITAAWAAAFAALVAIEAGLIWLPALPQGLAVAAGALALIGAFRFTKTYPDRMRAQALRS